MRDRVLSLLTETGKPVGVREIVRRLGLDAEARRELKGVLRAMIADGEVVKVRGARVGLPSRMNLVVGRLSANAGGFGFVVPEKKAPREADIYVSAVNMKEALHGDRVVARIERTTSKGAEGRIIRVLERATQRIVGRFESDGKFGGRVIPFDRRVLHELFIPPDESGDAQPGLMVLAEITRPPTADAQPGRPRPRRARPPRGPGRRPPGHHGQVRPARRVPARRRRRRRRGSRPRSAPRTSRGARTSGPGTPSPSTPRPPATTTTPSAWTA